LLCDAYGSFPFNKSLAKELLQTGIRFRLYSPLFSSESIFFGRRLHHKIVVADKKTALVGGINMADKYNDTPGEPAWLDYAVLIHGDVCEYLHLLCESVYKKKLRSRLAAWERKKQEPVVTKKSIRFRRNDFMKRKNEIHQSYTESIGRAQKSIVILASYFLPGTRFRTLLQKAALRGVRIHIILAGKSDVPSVKLAQDYLYEFYLRNNIQLYEWQDSVLHAKTMLVDKSWATIGSYNLNFLSRYISIELNADIQDAEFIEHFSNHIDRIMQEKCIQVELKEFKEKRGILYTFKMKLAYLFHRLLMNVVMVGRINK
jgi:cardiolipin synthase